MRMLPKRFDFRITYIFWLLLLCFALFLGFTYHFITWRLYDEWEQRLHWHIADHLAHSFAPLFKKEADHDLLEQELHKISKVNPRLEVYILSSEGEILLPRHLHQLRKGVLYSELIKKMNSFLTPGKARSLPLYGPHLEYSPLVYNRIFSTARINYGGKPAYIYVVVRSNRAEIFWRSLYDAYGYLSIGFFWLVITLIVGLVGAFVFFRVTSRVRHITKAVRKITHGDFSEKIPEEGTDEVSELGSDINRMSQSIEQSIHKLEETDRLRRELVGNISHDLKTPIASMLAYLEALSSKEEIQSNPELKKHLNVAVSNAAALSSLAQDLFELSRLEARDIKPREEPFSILEVVTEDVLPRLRPLAAQQDIALEVAAPEWLPLVVADQAMITRTLTNLIENGIKYSGKSCTVIVELNEMPGEIRILIRDNGQGISKEDLPRIFERFYRVDKARTKGRGLGLAIVKQIIEAHNRSIEVESTVGRGTRFSFSLPISHTGSSLEEKQ